MIRLFQIAAACVAALLANAGQAQAGVITYTGGFGSSGTMTNTMTFTGRPSNGPYTENGITLTDDGDFIFSYAGAYHSSQAADWSGDSWYNNGGSSSPFRVELSDGSDFRAFQMNIGDGYGGNSDLTTDVYIRAYDNGSSLIDDIFLDNVIRGGQFAFSSDTDIDYFELWAGPTSRSPGGIGLHAAALDNISIRQSLASVPEPSSMALCGVGACVAGFRAVRRRREKKQEA